MNITVSELLKDIDDENMLERLKCKSHRIMWNVLDSYSASIYKPYTNNALLIRMLEPIRNTKYDLDIKYKNHFKTILEIRCDDIIEKNNNNELVLFNKSQAELINKTLQSNHYDEIVVHCGAGISRSSAVMLSIAEYLNDKDMINYIKTIGFYMPNQYIYKMLSNTLLNINE